MACHVLKTDCNICVVYISKVASWSDAPEGVYEEIDGKGVRRRGWVEMDGLGCIIYRWKALLNLYTVVVKTW